MNKRPGQVNVTIEVGYCTVCGRTRNLRREEHHLGALVRTIVSCETCHRTLSSSIGVATAEPTVAEAAPTPVVAAVEIPVAKTKPTARAKPTVASTAAKKAPAKRPTKAVARGGKPTSTTTRRVTKKK